MNPKRVTEFHIGFGHVTSFAALGIKVRVMPTAPSNEVWLVTDGGKIVGKVINVGSSMEPKP